MVAFNISTRFLPPSSLTLSVVFTPNYSGFTAAPASFSFVRSSNGSNSFQPVHISSTRGAARVVVTFAASGPDAALFLQPLL